MVQDKSDKNACVLSEQRKGESKCVDSLGDWRHINHEWCLAFLKNFLEPFVSRIKLQY